MHLDCLSLTLSLGFEQTQNLTAELGKTSNVSLASEQNHMKSLTFQMASNETIPWHRLSQNAAEAKQYFYDIR